MNLFLVDQCCLYLHICTYFGNFFNVNRSRWCKRRVEKAIKDGANGLMDYVGYCKEIGENCY